MTYDDASALELFIKDHDTRFVPKAMEQNDDSYVHLKQPDGEELEIHSITEYREKYIDAGSPGPTIEEAWGKWMEGRK